MPFDATPIEKPLTEVQEILLAAAALVRRGHVKHILMAYTGEEVSFCAIGALRYAISGSTRDDYITHKEICLLMATTNRLVNCLGLGNASISTIIRWNDASCRTGEEVALAMEAAAREQ